MTLCSVLMRVCKIPAYKFLLIFLFTDISTFANWKNIENVFLNKGKEILILNSDAEWTNDSTDR